MPAFAVVIDRGLGLALDPGGFHQSLSPSRRLPHQPRLGVPAASLAVLEITGVGGGSTGAGTTPAAATGAGSRMVERRRGGSVRSLSLGCAPAVGAGTGRDSGVAVQVARRPTAPRPAAGCHIGVAG